MKSEFFIDRPVLSIVLSLVIVIVGLIGLFLLPIDRECFIWNQAVPTREDSPPL